MKANYMDASERFDISRLRKDRVKMGQAFPTFNLRKYPGRMFTFTCVVLEVNIHYEIAFCFEL